jgi:hypothetical protein
LTWSFACPVIKPTAPPYDHKLRFDYDARTAGGYADISSAVANGGCFACHTTKEVLPENR